MTVDAGVSIVISFACFAYLFAKKVYPLLTGALDDHISSVKQKIWDAEKLYDEATKSLESAINKKNEVDAAIKAERQLSEERIAKIKAEHAEYIKTLHEKYKASLEARFEAELARQKEAIVNKLAENVISKLLTNSGQLQKSGNLQLKSEDLKKLL